METLRTLCVKLQEWDNDNNHDLRVGGMTYVLVVGITRATLKL